MNKYKNETFDDNINNILNELSYEYKELLIDGIINNNNYNSLESINIRDIVEADSKIKRFMQESKLKRKKDRLYNIMRYIGIIYTLMGVVFYIITNMKLNIKLNLNNQIALILTLGGIGVATISTFLKEFKGRMYIEAHAENKSSKLSNVRIELIENWNEIERLSYKVAKYDLEGNNYIPLRKVLDKINDDNIITVEDMKKIKNILNVRNSLVHSTNKELSDNELIESLKNADEIIKKLNNISDRK